MNKSDLTGRTFGKYELLNRLGTGGMARVYKAYHENLDRYVALKVLYSDLAEEDEFSGRFEREAAAVARMRHPNIAQANEAAAEALRQASEFSQATSVAAEATARADANLRATAEFSTEEKRRIAEMTARDAFAAQEAAEFSAAELATAVVIAKQSALEAENQSRQVAARELAGIATDRLNSDPQLGLLLAPEAVNLTQSFLGRLQPLKLLRRRPFSATIPRTTTRKKYICVICG